MQFSAFKGPFEERIEAWNHKLFIIGEVLDKWLEARSRRLVSWCGWSLEGVGAAAARHASMASSRDAVDAMPRRTALTEMLRAGPAQLDVPPAHF